MRYGLFFLLAHLAACSLIESPEPEEGVEPFAGPASVAVAEHIFPGQPPQIVLEVDASMPYCTGGEVVMDVNRDGQDIYATLHHTRFRPPYKDVVCVYHAPTLGYAVLDLPVGEYRLHVSGPQRAGRYDVSVREDRIVTTARTLTGPMRLHDPVSLRIEEGTVRISCQPQLGSTPEQCAAFADEVAELLDANRLPPLGEGRQPFGRGTPLDLPMHFLEVPDHTLLVERWDDIKRLAVAHEVNGYLHTWQGAHGGFTRWE